MESPAAPATAASGPSVGEAVTSLMDRFRKLTTPNGNAADKPAAQASGAADGANPMAFRMVDIESWSQTSNLVLDPQCKTMVQPFGITDNAASLGLLAAKLKVKGYLDGLGKNAPQPLQIIDVLRLAAKSMNWMPMALETQLGESMLDGVEILDEDKNAESRRTYEQARKMLADIVKDLPQPLPYDFRLKVLTSSTKNASSLPGGIILVDRDLFGKRADLDYTYFVMAHEVSHVLQRHQTRAYQARLVDSVDTLEGLKNLTDGKAQINPGTLIGYSSALKKLFVNFTEQQELQADSCALQIVSKHIGDPKQLAIKLSRIEKQMGPLVQTAQEGPQGTQVLDHLKYLGDGVNERHPNTLQRHNNLKIVLDLNLGQK